VTVAAERLTVAVVVGNPKPASRTLTVGEEVGRQLAGSLSQAGDVRAAAEIFDLGTYGPAVLDQASAEVTEVTGRIAEADVVVAASPTYKATYTGLLKALFDRFQGAALTGQVGVPVMVGAAPIHAMAVDMHLRPLLLELGATCPSSGLFVMERDLERLEEAVSSWVKDAGPVIGAQAEALSRRQRA
jgi:FMN reductase